MSCECTDTDNDPIQMGLGPSHQLTESDIHDYQLPEKIGDKWRDLARALKFREANIDSIQKDQGRSTRECCITVLVRWMGREGRNASVKNLVAALIKAQLKNVADGLMRKDTTQNDIFDETISKMKSHCNCNCRHLEVLEEEVSKMRRTKKELEDKLSTMTKKYEEFERENATLRSKVSELERVQAIQRQQEQDNEEQVSKMRRTKKEPEDKLLTTTEKYKEFEREPFQGLGNSVDAAAKLEDVLGATRNFDTDQEARERQIGIQLKNLDKKLKTEVTYLLQVPEVKEDKLKTAVKLDLLTKLSKSLQLIYSDTQAMVAETCKCDEDLKREFYDFANHGLRAEHNDLVLRVNDLESSQAGMSDEEEKAFKRLQQYQNNRQRQIQRLANVLRGLFSSPESLPEASSSYPTGGNDSKKVLSRYRTYPGTRQKQTKSREGATGAGTPPTNDEEKSEVCIPTIKKRPMMKGIFSRSKKSKENMCFPVSHLTHRDS